MSKDIEHQPMSDTDIKYYLPDTPIMVFSKLKKYKSLEQLLPKEVCSVIILMEFSPMNGHWIALTRYKNVVSYFDAFGYSVEGIFRFFNKEQLDNLDENKHYIKNLFRDDNDFTIYYNDFDYQNKEDHHMATCGAHATYFALNNEKGLSLKQYKKMMEKEKKDTGLTYDAIVAQHVSKR